MSTTEERKPENGEAEEKNDDKMFDCNICLDIAKDAVVSMCGHLFCWPCLHQWLETRPTRQMCPVCKAAINRDKVVPIYGRGSTTQKDPRDTVPPRPTGQRSEPEQGSSFSSLFNGENGIHMSFGIGAFPFGFFASTMNLGDARPNTPPRGTQQYFEEQVLSKVFLWVAIVFMVWLVCA